MGNQFVEEVDHELLLVLHGNGRELGHVDEEGSAIQPGSALCKRVAVHQVLVVSVIADVLACIPAAFYIAALRLEISEDLLQGQSCL